MRWIAQAALAATIGMMSAGMTRAGIVTLSGPAAARPGGTVTIAVELPADLNNVYALQGGLMYDAVVLSPLPAQSGAAQGYHGGVLPPFPGETIPVDADLFRLNPQTPGRLLFGYVKNPADPAASPSTAVPPTALKITFSIAPDATGTTQIAWTPYTVNGRDLPALLAGARTGAPLDATAGAPLDIVLTLWGDADANGVVDIADVRATLYNISGLSDGQTTLFMENADVWPPGAPDGRLTLEDANRIARFIAGLDEVSP